MFVTKVMIISYLVLGVCEPANDGAKALNIHQLDEISWILISNQLSTLDMTANQCVIYLKRYSSSNISIMASCRTILIDITILSSLSCSTSACPSVSMLHISITSVRPNIYPQTIFWLNLSCLKCTGIVKPSWQGAREKPFHPIKPQHDDEAREAHFRQTSLKHGCEA